MCSDELTVKAIDKKWEKLGTGIMISSPSSRYRLLEREGREEVTKNGNNLFLIWLSSVFLQIISFLQADCVNESEFSIYYCIQ